MGYTKYDFQIVKLDKRAYYPRADDPMKMVRKEWERALYVGRTWHLSGTRNAFFGPNDDVAKQVRPIIIMDQKIKGAAFGTAGSFEGVPNGNNKSDLEALKLEAERQYKQATLDNTSNRIQTLLSMLGDVKVLDKDEMTYPSKTQLMYSSNYKVLEVKDCKIIVIEPEVSK